MKILGINQIKSSIQMKFDGITAQQHPECFAPCHNQIEFRSKLLCSHSIVQIEWIHMKYKRNMSTKRSIRLQQFDRIVFTRSYQFIIENVTRTRRCHQKTDDAFALHLPFRLFVFDILSYREDYKRARPCNAIINSNSSNTQIKRNTNQSKCKCCHCQRIA